MLRWVTMEYRGCDVQEAHVKESYVKLFQEFGLLCRIINSGEIEHGNSRT